MNVTTQTHPTQGEAFHRHILCCILSRQRDVDIVLAYQAGLGHNIGVVGDVRLQGAIHRYVALLFPFPECFENVEPRWLRLSRLLPRRVLDSP